MKSWITYKEDGTPSDKTEYEYTYVNGRISECDEFYYPWWEEGSQWGVSTSGVFRKYDETGRIILESAHMSMSGSLYFYGETEEYISRKISEEMGVNVFSDVKICDKSGRLLRVEAVDENGNRTLSERYTYDDAGRVIKHEDYWGDTFITEYVYNAGGQLDETYQRRGEGGGLYSQRAYYYDEHGYLVREAYADCYGSFDVIDYDYDERGRCVREETFALDWLHENPEDWREGFTLFCVDILVPDTGGFLEYEPGTERVEYTYY